MKLVDVHAHLDLPPINERLAEVLDNANNAGVKAIIANGVHPQSNRDVLSICKSHSIVKPALGFYPTHIHEVDERVVDEELDFIKKNKPIALGEVGLDYKFTDEEKQNAGALSRLQKIGFEKIISLSEKLKIPVIVHSRKAEADCIDMLESSNAKVVMHCFSGKKKLVHKVIDNGWSFSVPVIVIKLEQFQYLVAQSPLSQLLTETDTPYLGPERGLTNEPKNVSLTIEKIAQIKGLDKEEAANQVFKNYLDMF